MNAQGTKTILKLIASAYLLIVAVTGQALEANDVFDQFFRYTQTAHREFYEGTPDESIDPFSGTLHIVQTDLTLPGKAGLDLQIVRSYTSKIWFRTDYRDLSSLLAEQERSVLGYGWTFHMGRIRNPNASGAAIGLCSTDNPLLEMPDGSARVFYQSSSHPDFFISRDYWLMQKNCKAMGGRGQGTCVWSTSGVRYEFAQANSYFYGAGSPFVATMPVWPLSKIVDRHGNQILVHYLANGNGAIDYITDSYDRLVEFTYATGGDGLRLSTMTVNTKVYTYLYTAYPTLGGGTIAPTRFLTEVKPPAGPSYKYAYAISATIPANQYALSALTYPHGGTVGYTYASTGFYYGIPGFTAPFAVVSSKTVNDRNGTSLGTWSYSYSSPQSGMNTTIITRPDGKHDVYSMYGFGSSSAGSLWKVGLTQQISRADGAEVETQTWNAGPTVSSSIFPAPAYTLCVGSGPPIDYGVSVPRMTQRVVARDGRTYTTTTAAFDEYGQPLQVNETGEQSRETRWTYQYAFTDDQRATLNFVQGMPLTQHVCVQSTDCYDNQWTYYGPNYSRDSETLSDVKTTFGYDQYGNLSRATNALSQSLTLSNYKYGIPTYIAFNGAFSISRTVSLEGWILSETNGRGYTTNYEYDSIGRVTKVTPPVGNYTGYTYADDGSWSRLARDNYSKTTNLDGLGRVTSTIDSEGVRTNQRWNPMGWTWFKSYPYDNSIGEVGEWLDFDGLGRVIAQKKAYRPASGVCDASGTCEVDHSYSQNCTRTAIHRETGDNVTTERCNTSFGNPDEQRLTRVTDAQNKIWRYVYTAYGKLKSVTAPLSSGNRSYTYNGKQFLTSETSSESGTVTYPSYNSIGQPLTRTDARRISWTYGYNDPLSRLRRISYGSSSPDNVTKDYDKANNVAEIASTNGGTFTYSYDELNRVTSQRWIYGGHTYTTSYRYDSAGCLYSMTYPTGTVLSMTCDTANRVKSVTLARATIVDNVTYHPSGQVKGMAYGNSKSTSVIYDDRARAKTVTAAGVIDLRYNAYDGADNLKSFENRAVANTLRTMEYDELDRLVSVVAPSLWGSATYDYDELGNRTFKSPGGSTSVNYTYDSKNRLVSASGPVDQLPKPLTLTWSPAGRLAATTDGATYLYDGLGRRVQKTVSGQAMVYHYDAAGRVLAETLPDGTKLRDYIYLGNKLIAISGCVEGLTSSTCSGLQWYHTDTLGSVVARTDTNGAVVAQFDYQPWGEQWTVPAVQGDRQYNGRVYDPGTGFHDYGARLYWPEIGRFISADTFSGSIANPATFNRYSYVTNNPYKYVDPTGMWGESVHLRATRRWAVAAGFSPAQAETMAQADNGTDAGGTGPMPWQDQSRHFNTASAGTDSRTNWYNAEFEEAVTAGTFASLYRQMAQAHPNESFATEIQFWENSAMSALGRALHSLQDIYAHSREYQKESGGVYYHDDPITDREEDRPVAFQNTQMATEQALRLYKEKVASRVQNGNGD